MIVGFRDKRTEAFYRGGRAVAFLRLRARGLGDLARPGNRLEALKGRRRGQWSIRINAQWRVCFTWPEGSPGPRGAPARRTWRSSTITERRRVMREPIHPGETLREDLDALGMSAAEFARRICVARMQACRPNAGVAHGIAIV